MDKNYPSLINGVCSFFIRMKCLLFLYSCDLLSRDAAAEGDGGRAGEEVQEGRHAGHRGRRQ